MDAKPMLVKKYFRVNPYDIDVMGIVSNIVYIRWFEDLRFLLLDKQWSYKEMLGISQSPILSKTEIEYKRPLTIFDEPVGELWVSDLTKSHWTVSIQIKKGERLICAGRQMGYFYDLNKKRPVAIPSELMQKYQSWL